MPKTFIKGYIKQAIIDARERTAGFEKKYQRLPTFKSRGVSPGAKSRAAKKAELAILQHTLSPQGWRSKLSPATKSGS